MNLESKKLQVDILGKEIDILHKKILILIGGVAGSWFYSIEFLKNDLLFINLIAILLIFTFIFFIIGLIINFLKLNKISSKLKRILNDLE